MLFGNRVLFEVPYDHRHGLEMIMKLNTKLITTPKKIYINELIYTLLKYLNCFSSFSNLDKSHVIVNNVLFPFVHISFFFWEYLVTHAFSVTCIATIDLSTCHLSTCYVTWPMSKCQHKWLLYSRTRLLVMTDGFIWHQTKARSFKKTFCEG